MPEHDAHGHGDAHGAHGRHEESPLEKMLHALDDETITEKITVPHQTARESFAVEDHAITDYNAFVQKISKYVKHHLKNANATTEEVSDANAFSESYVALQEGFRNQGGFKHALELAKRGRMREVIDAIAEQLQSRASQEYNHLHTVGVVAPDDFDTQSAIVKGIFERMKTLDPSLNLGKPELFAHDYARVVSTYNQLLRTVREQYGAREAHDEHGHGAHGHDAHGGGHDAHAPAGHGG